MSASAEPQELRVTIEALAEEVAEGLGYVEDSSAVVSIGRRLDETAKVLELLPEGVEIVRYSYPRSRRVEFVARDERGVLVAQATRVTFLRNDGSRVSSFPLVNVPAGEGRAQAVVLLLAALDAESRS